MEMLVIACERERGIPAFIYPCRWKCRACYVFFSTKNRLHETVSENESVRQMRMTGVFACLRISATAENDRKRAIFDEGIRLLLQTISELHYLLSVTVFV